jgi:hypothetical protein
MAQRSSFSKLQRDRDKQAKQAAKRDRRQNRDATSDDVSDEESEEVVEVEASEILAQVEQLQREFDADVIDFEIYEKRKAELLSQIQI